MVITKKQKMIYGNVLGALYRKLHVATKDKNWVMTTKKYFGKTAGQIDKYICGDIYSLKVIFIYIYISLNLTFPMNYIILHQFIHLFGFNSINYISILYRFVVFP